MLVSHNIVNCMDPELPASLSPAVHKILREECGFDGIAITDDLAMDAVKAYAKDGAVAVLALQAGNDMVVTTDYRTQIPAVIAAVQEGWMKASSMTPVSGYCGARTPFEDPRKQSLIGCSMKSSLICCIFENVQPKHLFSSFLVNSYWKDRSMGKEHFYEKSLCVFAFCWL